MSYAKKTAEVGAVAPLAPGAVWVALDTSSDLVALAVGRVGVGHTLELLATGDELCRRHANTRVVDALLAMLERAGVALSQVDAFVVGRGPGSFTGVRIGVACAKGLAMGRDRRLYGASTLDAVAWQAWLAGTRGALGVVADAMRGEVYPGLYDLDETGPTRLFATEEVVKAPACIERWSAAGLAGALTLTGDGLAKYGEAFAAAGFTAQAAEDVWRAGGEAVLMSAVEARVDLAQSGDPALVLPVYTRLSDAEENEAKRLGRTAGEGERVEGVASGLADRHLMLRPMLVTDCAQVAELEAATYAESAHTPWSEALFAQDLERKESIWWVAHDQGRIVGFCGAQLVAGDAEILDVCVSAARRRAGIAKRLLARVTYDAQMLAATSSSLEVDVHNEAACALYETLGYATVGVRRDYYATGHDAAIMKAALPLVVEANEHTPDPTAQVRPWPPVRASRTPAEEAALLAAAPLTLAIESSCDETAMAVIDAKGAVVASVVATQIDFHARFGGVVPEIASRKHTEAVVGVLEATLEQAAATLNCGYVAPTDLHAVAVTQGPGLVGALVVGIAFAKGLAASAGCALVGVNHLEGHLFANILERPELEPPFVASLISGGHTMLVYVRNWGDYQVLGQTIDDAAGEAFDKVAKALGLGYPGGPVISRLAQEGNPRAIDFPRAMLHSHDYRFSLSGLKTAVVTYLAKEQEAGRAVNVPNVCASFQAAVVDVQVAKAKTACLECGVSDFCLGGGVAANPELRADLERELAKVGVRVTTPPFSACTDNAAMIGLAGYYALQTGRRDGFDLDADPHMSL